MGDTPEMAKIRALIQHKKNRKKESVTAPHSLDSLMIKENSVPSQCSHPDTQAVLKEHNLENHISEEVRLIPSKESYPSYDMTELKSSGITEFRVSKMEKTVPIKDPEVFQMNISNQGVSKERKSGVGPSQRKMTVDADMEKKEERSTRRPCKQKLIKSSDCRKRNPKSASCEEEKSKDVLAATSPVLKMEKTVPIKDPEVFQINISNHGVSKERKSGVGPGQRNMTVEADMKEKEERSPRRPCKQKLIKRSDCKTRNPKSASCEEEKSRDVLAATSPMNPSSSEVPETNSLSSPTTKEHIVPSQSIHPDTQAALKEHDLENQISEEVRLIPSKESYPSNDMTELKSSGITESTVLKMEKTVPIKDPEVFQIKISNQGVSKVRKSGVGPSQRKMAVEADMEKKEERNPRRPCKQKLIKSSDCRIRNPKSASCEEEKSNNVLAATSPVLKMEKTVPFKDPEVFQIKISNQGVSKERKSGVGPSQRKMTVEADMEEKEEIRPRKQKLIKSSDCKKQNPKSASCEEEKSKDVLAATSPMDPLSSEVTKGNNFAECKPATEEESTQLSVKMKCIGQKRMRPEHYSEKGYQELQRRLKKLSLPFDEKADADFFVKKIIEEVILQINKVDARFCWEPFYSGSVYDKTKILKHDEYDVIVVCSKFSSLVQDQSILSEDVPSVFCALKVPGEQKVGMESLLTKSEKGFYWLSPKAFKTYFYELVHGAMKSVEMTQLQSNYRLRTEKIKCADPGTSPAVKVFIPRPGNRHEYSIDFVPAIETRWPKCAASWTSNWLPPEEIRKCRAKCYVVPKLHHTEYEKMPDDCYLWRYGFNCAEKRIILHADGTLSKLEKKTCRKDILRLLKEDKELFISSLKIPGWQIEELCSYWVKSTMLHLYEKIPDCQEWVVSGSDKMTLLKRYLDALNLLIEALTQQNLPHYFINDANLLYKAELCVSCCVQTEVKRFSETLRQKVKKYSGE